MFPERHPKKKRNCVSAHAMNSCKRSAGIGSFILKLSARWTCVQLDA